MHPAMRAAPQPSRSWTIGTTTLIAVAATSALLSLFLIMLYVAGYLKAAVEGSSRGFGEASYGSALFDLMLGSASWLDWISPAIAIGSLWGVYQVRRQSIGMLESLGEPMDLAADETRNWALKLWTALLIISVLLRFIGFGSVDHTKSQHSWAHLVIWSASLAIAYAPRLLALVCLLIGVALLRVRVRRAATALTAGPVPFMIAPPAGGIPFAAYPAAGPAFPSVAPGSAPAPAFTPPGPALTPGPTLTPGPAFAPAPSGETQRAPAAETTMPAADDAFWERVRALSDEKGHDLALLETTKSASRWLIVPAGDPLRVRAELAPGSVVTVYGEPLRPSTDAPTKPPVVAPGTEWYGLIEHAGTTRFQLVLPTRLPDWFSRARRASRYGLYRAGDPAALVAAVPAITDAADDTRSRRWSTVGVPPNGISRRVPSSLAPRVPDPNRP